MRRLPATLVLLALTSAACTSSNPELPPVAATPADVSRFSAESTIPLDPAVVHGVLSNGLEYYVRENREPENRASLRLVVQVGSLQEDDDQRGLAHFVEHMAFNGTENFEKQEIVDYLEGIGMQFGPHVNAYTSFDQTVYMLELPMDDPAIVARGLDILREWAGRIAFEAEEIDKERGVVVEEWRLRRGAGGRIQDKELPVLYHGSRYAERNVIGEKSILENASHETIRRYYETWYRPELMAVVAVGDFETESIVSQIRSEFDDLRGTDGPERVEYPVPDHEETLVSIVADPEATGTSVTLGFKRPVSPYETVGDLRSFIIDRLAESLLSRRLDEIRRRSDPPFQFAYAYTGDLAPTRSMFRMYARVPEGRVERAVETLLTEAQRVEEHGFTATELARTKVTLLRGIDSAWQERDQQESANLAGALTAHYLERSPTPGLDYWRDFYHEIVPTITLEEINERAEQWITEDNRVILVSSPEAVQQQIPSEADLISSIDAAGELAVTPWVDAVRDEPFVSRQPEPGTIVDTRRIEELGVTIWTLSNGVEVYLKPTDFKNDEVLLTGFSPGGHSLVSDEDYQSASFASRLVAEMGSGNFSPVELQKALAGKIAYATAGIGEMFESVGGQASPQDLSTMFELLYLQMTSPRLDRSAAESFLARERANIEHREGSPEFQFSKKFSEVVSGDHPRRGFTTIQDLAEIDAARAVEIHSDRFADADDFRFVLVGAIDVDQIRPLVEKWLGGLPATDREETWREVEIDFPEGVVEFEVVRGIEPKGRVTIRFEEPAEWSPANAFQMQAMADALRIRLREVLREDMGGVYGVFVNGRISRWYDEAATLTIGFGCEPERIEELTAAVFREIETFRSEGPSTETVEKVRQAELRQREVALRENRFWLGQLEWYLQNDLDPRGMLRHEERVGELTVESMRQAAAEWIDPESYVLGTLRPEK